MTMVGRFPHLMLTGLCRRQLSDAEARVAMPGLARHIGMTPIGPPAVNICPDHPWGASFIQGVSESHISIHYMAGPYAALDFFTCSQIDDPAAWVRKIEKYLVAHFYITAFTERKLFWRGPFGAVVLGGFGTTRRGFLGRLWRVLTMRGFG